MFKDTIINNNTFYSNIYSYNSLISDLRFPVNLATRLQKLYNETTTHLKQEGTNVLQLMSCNMFHPKTNGKNNAFDEHIQKRCTIQSTEISTISSLVDKSKINNNINKNQMVSKNEITDSSLSPPTVRTTTPAAVCDTQKENVGLYALKCNRNAIRRDTMFANFSHHETKPYNNINVYPSLIPAATASPEPYSDVIHEIFSPCQMDNENSEALNSLNYNREYYKIEFSEEGGLKEIAATNRKKSAGINTTTTTTPTLTTKSDGNGVTIKPSDNIIAVCDSNRKTFKTQIPPPPRKKKISVPQQQTQRSTSAPSMDDSNGCSVNLVFKSKPQPRLLESCKQNDLSYYGKRNNGGVTPTPPSRLPPPSSVKVKEQVKLQRNTNNTTSIGNTNIDTNMNKFNLKKNPSELYRIAAAIGNKSENFHDNDESKLNADNNTIVVYPPLRKKSIERKCLTKQFSRSDSVNIFEKKFTPENAFDDFSDILKEEPVVHVKYSTTLHNQQQQPNRNNMRKEFSRFSSSDSDEIVEFSQKSINRKIVNDSFENNYKYNKMPEAKFSSTFNVTGRKNSCHSLSQNGNGIDTKIAKQIIDLSVGNEVVLANKPQFRNANLRAIDNPYNNINNHNNININNNDMVGNNSILKLEDSKLYMSNDGNFNDDNNDDDDDDQQNLKQIAADEGDGLCTQVLCNDNHNTNNKSINNKDLNRVKLNNNNNNSGMVECGGGRIVKHLAPPPNRNVYKIINLVTV